MGVPETLAKVPEAGKASAAPLHIGILQTDSVPDGLEAEHGDYPDMFADLLTDASAEPPRFSVIDVQAGAWPEPASCDAWLITGSKDGVYDDLPWIGELVSFVRAALQQNRCVIGICFGHQLLAHHFGGRAERSPKGWGVGVHRSQLLVREPWLEAAESSCNLLYSHRDQVVAMPPGARLIATHPFCPIAGFALGDQVLTFQGHPEFRKPYARALMAMRRPQLGEPVYQAGSASLAEETHQARVGRWILNFCEAQRRRAAQAGAGD